jgi:two-component system, chemotaxis family, CheB/CheR fusion protein
LFGLTHQDFSSYKQSTILRQIERRMKLNFQKDLNQYVLYLQENPEEIQLLFSELLIGVTRFFRDPEAILALEKLAILPLIQKDPESEIPIRVWVPACSTGEEAYSIAITFQEQLEALGVRRKVQIYATDIDPQAINHARAGVYRASIQSDLSEERLQRFFTQNGSMYQVKKSIRDMVVFAVQNLIMDPPFSRLDLISCRNLLIYLEPETQGRVFPLFHYALTPGGFLFLGNAETVGGFGDFFSTLDRRNKIYRKKETAQPRIGEVKFRVPPGGHTSPEPPID